MRVLVIFISFLMEVRVVVDASAKSDDIFARGRVSDSVFGYITCFCHVPGCHSSSSSSCSESELVSSAFLNVGILLMLIKKYHQE